MTNEKKLRRMKHLMGIVMVYPHNEIQRLRDIVSKKLEGWELSSPVKANQDIIREIFHLSKELGYNDDKLKDLWLLTTSERRYIHKMYHKPPPRESRDNKNVRNLGSGNHNRNTIRYPRQSRSLATWRKFYTLFPYQAKIDQWNGKTSLKYKGK